MKLAKFWRTNKTLIISIVGILLLVNFCARMWQSDEVVLPSLEREELLSPESNDGENRVDTYEEIISKQLRQEPSIFDVVWQIIVTFSLVGVLLYYGFTRGWYARFIPKWVAFNTPIYRDKISQRLVMRISVSNNTNESKTFLSPQIYFRKWQEVRKFNIKTSIFPLTLTPGTRQDVVIDIDQFWEQTPDLTSFKQVGAFISETNGKVHRTWARPKWFLLDI